MQSIVYQDKAGGPYMVYSPPVESQRTFYDQKRSERILAALDELKNTGNVRIYRLKKGRLRLIAERDI